ncbi:VOC family protein [Actinoplanes sp. NPDC051475]|uniref:VOC family protein n=1 Tax=Actinoplanes sp. NPDC051475 TaxID=3157225 RepID=UPI00344DAEA4
MAKERPVTAGGTTANDRGRHPAVPPARPAPTAGTPGPRRPASAGPAQTSPADPRPIPPPFLAHQEEPSPEDTADDAAASQPEAEVVPAPRSEVPKRGVARVPSPRPVLPGLQLQPMVHVAEMADAVAFYERLGGEIVHGDRDGEWVLMQVGTAQIGLVTRPPDPAHGESTVELNFSATMPLERLEKMLRDRGVTVVRLAMDPDLGARLHVETPDGMPVKIHQVEPDLLI